VRIGDERGDIHAVKSFQFDSSAPLEAFRFDSSVRAHRLRRSYPRACAVPLLTIASFLGGPTHKLLLVRAVGRGGREARHHASGDASTPPCVPLPCLIQVPFAAHNALTAAGLLYTTPGTPISKYLRQFMSGGGHVA
jgi:hypothetical protein